MNTRDQPYDQKRVDKLMKQEQKQQIQNQIEFITKNKKKSKIKPFRILVVAQSAGGKTYLIKELIEDIQEMKLIEDINWISSTGLCDEQQLSLIGSGCNCVDSNKENVNEWLKNNIDARLNKIENQQYVKPQLIVFDDMISEDLLNGQSKKSNILKRYLTSGRHTNISVIILVQNLKSVPKICRLQMSNILIGLSPDQDSIQQWLKEYRGVLSLQEILQKYRVARQTNNGYGFLHIQTLKKDDDPDRIKSGIVLQDLLPQK